MAKKEIWYDRATHQFVGLSDDIVEELSSIYLGVNVRRELKKMGLWLLEHPERKGSLNFISNWLKKTQPDNAYYLKLDLEDDSSPLNFLLKNYLDELWKTREHIFIINSIQKR